MTDTKGLALLRELDKAAKEYAHNFAGPAVDGNAAFDAYVAARTALHRHLEGIS